MTVLLDNYVELFNELTILAVFTFLTPYVHDSGFSAERKYDHGFVVSSIVFLNVIVNFVIFGRSTYSQLKIKIGAKVKSIKEKALNYFKKAKKQPISITSDQQPEIPATNKSQINTFESSKITVNNSINSSILPLD